MRLRSASCLIDATVGWQAYFMKRTLIALAAALWAVPAAAETFGDRWVLRSPGSTVEPSQRGVASVYWEDAHTATGERFRPHETDPAKWTCATPDFPLNTVVTVYRGDKVIRCRANDRGPAKRLNRVIDLTPPAAEALGISRKIGLGNVTIRRFE
jgi:rare lipoprotein A (peptidoglycan hydrolase)